VSRFQLDIPPHVAEILRHLHPDLKQVIKSALRALASDPELGDPLLKDLAGLWKYRVKRFRIVYGIDRKSRRIRIMAVGHRRRIYEEMADLIRKQP
jgi:mRNA interferase RelE/StbE